MLKKFIGLLLAVMLVFSTTAVAVMNVSAAIGSDGRYVSSDNIEQTRRYYFAMPSDWYNEYTDTAGVYWWEGGDDGTGTVTMWPGYKAQVSDVKDVYYVDCPTDVSVLIWNNFVDGGTNKEAPVFAAARQSANVKVDYYTKGDSELYNSDFFAMMEESYNSDKAALGDFANNFFMEKDYGFGLSFTLDNMIYIIDPERTTEALQGKLKTYVGDWYFYYGNGEYGTYPTKEASEKAGTFKKLNDDTTPTTPTLPDTDSNKIYFDVRKSDWGNVKRVFCHIWRVDGSRTSSGTEWPLWQSKQEYCDYDSETGIASYDLSKTENTFSKNDGKIYCVIFSANTGMQTYNIIMNGNCIGDTVYCTGQLLENPEDSSKTAIEAAWMNNADCGAEKKITSTGNIIGSAYPDGESDNTLLAQYLMAYYNDPDKMSLVQGLFDKLNVYTTDVYNICVERIYKQVEIGSITADEAVVKLISISNTLSEVTGHDLPYETLGDVDGDGSVNVMDATLIQKYCSSLSDFTEEQLAAGDVNRDERVDVLDATEIQKYCCDLESVLG